jgi:hypothetical protein
MEVADFGPREDSKMDIISKHGITLILELQNNNYKNQKSAYEQQKSEKSQSNSFCSIPALDRFNLLPVSYTHFSLTRASSMCL